MLEVDVLVIYGEVHALHVAMQTTSAIALVVASKGNGDDDQGFAREIEPWESSDGGIYLLRELSAVAPSKATKFLPVLVELVSAHTYQHPCIMHHSLCFCVFSFRFSSWKSQNLFGANFVTSNRGCQFLKKLIVVCCLNAAFVMVNDWHILQAAQGLIWTTLKFWLEPGSLSLGLPNVFWHSNHKHQQVSQFVLLLVSTGTKFWICKVSQSDGDTFQAVALNCSGANSPLSVLEFGSLRDCSLENIPAHHMLQQGNPGWHGYASGLCKEYITALEESYVTQCLSSANWWKYFDNCHRCRLHLSA